MGPISFNAGEIEATATVNTEPFQLALVRMDQEGRKFADKKYKATVGADTAEADRKIDDTEAKLKGVGSSRTTAKVSADTALADAKINPLTARLEDIRDRISTARVTADTETAKLRLDQIDLAARRINERIIRPKVTIDGIDRADLQLDALELRLRALSLTHATPSVSGSSGGRGGISGVLHSIGGHAPSSLALGVGAAIPTLAPLLGLVAGAGAGLLTPFTAAGIGITSFGLAAHSSISKVQADLKTLTADQAAYNAATSDKTRAAAQAKELKFWSSLPKSQQTAVTNLHKLSGEWSAFQKSLQPEIFPLISGGIGLLNSGLKDLQPVAKATGGALDGIEKSVQGAFNSPFFHDFFTNFLPGQAVKATDAFAHSLGNLLEGGAHLVEAFAPLGGGFEADLERLTKRFDNWSQGDGPARFVKWVHTNSPIIKHDIEEIASGVTSVAKALLPVGTEVLHDVGAVASVIGKFSQDHPGDIKKIGEALLVVGGGLKVIAGADKAIAVIKAAQLLLLGGPGRIPGIGGAGGAGASAAEREIEGGAGLTALGRLVQKVGPRAVAEKLGTAGLGTTLGVTYLAAHGDSAQGAEAAYRRSIQSQQPVSNQVLENLVNQITLQIAKAHPNSNINLAPSGIKYNAGGAASVSNPAQAIAFIKQYGSQAQIARVDQASLSVASLNKQLGLGIPLSQSAIDKADKYGRLLLSEGLSVDTVKAKVAQYVQGLGKVPTDVHTKVTADISPAQRALNRFLREADDATANVSINALRSRGLIPSNTPGVSRKVPHGGVSSSVLASHPSVVGQFSSNVSGSSHLPGFLSGEGTTSPNAPTSSTSHHSSGAPSAATVANGIASIVNYSGLTFLTDLEGTSKEVRTGITTMIDRLNDAVRKHYLSSDSVLVKALNNARSPLRELADEETKVAKDLATARSRLSSLRGQASTTRSSTLSSFQGLGDIGAIAPGTSVGGIISVLGQQDKVAGAFARNLGILRKKGLSDQAYMTLLNEGPAAVGQEVAELATASRSQIHRINTDESRLGALGRSTGSASSDYLFGARIKAQAADVHRLAGENHQLVSLQNRSAKALEALVKDGVKDKGTHMALATLHADLARIERLLKTDAAGAAAVNKRAHVAGVRR